jgi:hypothetical protein
LATSLRCCAVCPSTCWSIESMGFLRRVSLCAGAQQAKPLIHGCRVTRAVLMKVALCNTFLGEVVASILHLLSSGSILANFTSTVESIYIHYICKSSQDIDQDV